MSAHASSIEALLADLGSDAARGLDAARVAAQRAKHGLNRFPEPPHEPLVRRILKQLASPLVLTLVAAALISVVVGTMSGDGGRPLERYGDAIAIFLIVLLNAAIGLFQEQKATSAIDALRNMTVPRARVRRDGKATEVSAEDVVPGDVLELQAGDAIAADARLLDSTELAVEEASLTGESTATTKDSKAPRPENAPLAERRNMVFQGTTIVRGSGSALVVATGAATELGRIGGMIASATVEPTHLEKQLDGFGKKILYGCLAVSALLFGWGMLRPHVLAGASARPWHLLLLEAVSFAVAAIPEGLPAITTITLAMGTRRMAKRGAIVRKLPAIETLGAATVIASDKTGTLTQNRMVVREALAGGALLTATGEGYAPEGSVLRADGIAIDPKAMPAALTALLETAAICNDAALERDEAGAWKVVGDPTEGALLAFAARGGREAVLLRSGLRTVATVPFDSGRKRMTVVVEGKDGHRVAHVKGSTEVLLAKCTSIASEAGTRPITGEDRAQVTAEADAMASRALRVLAFAQRVDPVGDPEQELTFVGLTGMMDPPRDGIPDAVRACREAGVRVLMITGDQKLTAAAVAREIGVWQPGDETLTGAELAEISDEELPRRVARVSVFARTTPEQKLRIVRALKASGEIVAMTGDGVNDAPALREAHIGIAMGRSGTEVARQAAALVLADDNFVTIVAAIHEGRSIYRNIQKFVFFLLSSNAGLAVAVFAISLRGSWLPLTPLMILWINLVTNGLPALALGVDPADPAQMSEPPRQRGEAFFGMREIAGLAFVGLIMGLGAVAMYAWNFCEHAAGPQGPRTLAFTVLAMSPLLHAWSCRSPRDSLFAARPLLSRALLAAIVVSAVVQLVALLIPWLRPMFHTDSLGAHDWLMVAIASMAVVPAVELAKAISRARRPPRRHDAPTAPRLKPVTPS